MKNHSKEYWKNTVCWWDHNDAILWILILHQLISQTCIVKSSMSSRVLFSSVQSLSHVRLFATPWTAACQASLSINNSWSFLKLISIAAFSKSSLNIWKFLGHILLKPILKDFEHYFSSMWNECNCMVVWTFFGITLLWDWKENWPFPVLWPLLSFPFVDILSAAFSSIVF